MVDKISGFIRKRRSAKLYKQWVERDGLPPEEVPQVAKDIESADESVDLGHMPEEDFYRATRRQNIDSRFVTLPIRYILLGSGLIALLLVLLAVVSTVLIMQSC